MVGGVLLQVPSGRKTTGLSWALEQGSFGLDLGLTGTLNCPRCSMFFANTSFRCSLTPLARVGPVWDTVATQCHISGGGGIWRRMGPQSWAEFFPLLLVLVAHKQEALDGVPCHEKDWIRQG